jgi:DNA-binding transcriptional regulator YhcF (GntR family)
MKSRFLLNSNDPTIESNIYADKSALILEWLLREGVKRSEFSLRELAKELEVSLGLVQRVLSALVLRGLLEIQGVRTAKKFFFNKPRLLLQSWLDHYSMTKKCKMRTYRSAFSEKAELIDALNKAKLNQDVALALHSAAEAYGYKNTNLNTLELYILNPTIRLKLEDILQLEPQERGYEVLLIEPYYKSLLSKESQLGKDLKISSVILTFLDLYHFPLRGEEQAKFMAERAPELKRIFNDGE